MKKTRCLRKNLRTLNQKSSFDTSPDISPMWGIVFAAGSAVPTKCRHHRDPQRQEQRRKIPITKARLARRLSGGKDENTKKTRIVCLRKRTQRQALFKPQIIFFDSSREEMRTSSCFIRILQIDINKRINEL